MNHHFRKATLSDLPQVWDILQQAILRRKKEGSQQWQDGYPNPQVIQQDIEAGAGYVLAEGDTLIGYCAIFFNDEPDYKHIQGKWLTQGDYLVVHRVAISAQYAGKGLAKTIFTCIEDIARKHHIYSIKADTNFDNMAMLKTFEKSGFTYCGEVYVRGNPRKAFEKVLSA
jgi:GNAT superfamily N-acetyltransferase